MTKKGLIFLLAPSAFFAAMAGLSFYWAGALLPEPQREQATEKNIADLVQKAQNGEFGPKPDRLIGVVSTSWRTKDLLHESLGEFHAKTSRLWGCGILVGVALQVYVTLRFIAARSRLNPKS